MRPRPSGPTDRRQVQKCRARRTPHQKKIHAGSLVLFRVPPQETPKSQTYLGVRKQGRCIISKKCSRAPTGIRPRGPPWQICVSLRISKSRCLILRRKFAESRRSYTEDCARHGRGRQCKLYRSKQAALPPPSSSCIHQKLRKVGLDPGHVPELT